MPSPSVLAPSANQIKAARLAAGLKQSEAAERFGVDVHTWSRWERDAMVPSGRVARDLAAWVQNSQGEQ